MVVIFCVFILLIVIEEVGLGVDLITGLTVVVLSIVCEVVNILGVVLSMVCVIAGVVLGFEVVATR